LSKYALIIYAVNKLGRNSALAAQGLSKLEQALARWITNQQQQPWAYDPVWGGIVSTASYDGGDVGRDFGNTFYNDHHFHFGYFVHTAAVIAHLHPDWLKQGTNKVWVDTLIRDYANSDVNDPYFPPKSSL
jgi:endo-1,3(4)-beta-glucanase